MTVPNCRIHNNFKTCIKCNDGFFEQLGSCVPYPQVKIYNCVVYASVDSCLECLPGMFLKSPTECVKVSSVSECVTYDARADQTKCLECQKDFFLSEPNVCSKRTKNSQISSCALLDKLSETCLACEEDSTLTSDMKKCLPSLQNCKVYAVSDSNSRIHSCEICVDGYYYDQNKKNCE